MRLEKGYRILIQDSEGNVIKLLSGYRSLKDCDEEKQIQQQSFGENSGISIRIEEVDYWVFMENESNR